MWTIGIDIGTTTISAVVMRTDVRSIEKAYTLANDCFLLSERPWEKIQDPESILRKAAGLLEEILKEYPDVDGIGLTGQMHGIVYLDETGTHISPLFTWQDGSGSQKCLEGRNICEYVEQKYQAKLYTGYGMATYLYHVVTGQVPEGAAGVCTIMDYLGMYLTGRKTPLIHVSNAASLGLFDAQQGRFQSELLEAMGADPALLPQVAPGMELLGTYHGIPVSVAIGDNQASFLGSVEQVENTLLVNMGTGGQISVFSKNYCNIEGIETRPFMERDYLLVGSSLCGGRAYALLEGFFRSYARALGADDGEQYEVMDRLLREQSVSEHLKVVTAFSGTRQNPEKRGEIHGIGTENFTPAGLIRGVLEGMSQELYDMYAQMIPHLEKLPDKIVASGNGIRKNHHLQEIVSGQFSLPIQLSDQKEEAACGAAVSAVLFLKKKDKNHHEKSDRQND